ncbi:MAG TPA: 3-deoxy-D-manno-octulosonic acid transferase [Nitrospiraceae bacterium]|nr:3-deoxy-D-manno-octulosonic acid transferase [Nitrospiraceae bacterium]
MWYFLYNLALLIASPAILTILLAKQRCRRGIPQRVGWYPSESGDRESTQPVIWVHAVSLGEVTAAVPLVRMLHIQHPDYRLIVTTVTETGREAVEQRLAGVAEHRYVPLDFPWVVSSVIQRWRPALFICVETELWPNLLRILSSRGVPVVLVNGRLSSRSYRGYRFIRPLMKQMLAAVTCCLMQSNRDAERITNLGAPADRVLCTGNIKFDQPVPHIEQTDSDALRNLLLTDDEELFVAGSTHPGEEEQVLDCYRALVQQFPNLILLLAPRHIERAAQVETAVAARGFPAVRRSLPTSESAPLKGPRVLILDTRGELAKVYRYAVATFVGGTFVPIGGHNLLEPAIWRKPVFFGPYTDHCAEIADLLLRADGGRRAADGADLAVHVAALLRDRSALERMGHAAQQVVLDNRGALEQTAGVITRLLRTRTASADQQMNIINRQARLDTQR